MPSLGLYSGGINNRAPRGRLPTSKQGMPLFARNANNMVFDSEGSVFSRPGPEQVLSGSWLRDGFSCAAGAYFRDGSTIKEFYLNSQGQEAARDICSGVVGKRVAWAHFNGKVFFSDNIIAKKIINGVCENWGTPLPVEAPLLSGSSTLGQGQVMACYSYLLDNGQESGTSPVAISSFGRVVSNLKRSPDSRVAAIRVYMTHPGNETFFLAATVLPSDTSVTVTSNYVGNLQPPTRGKIPPPSGQLICEHAGRIYIAKGNVVYWSDPNAHDLFSLGENTNGDPRWAAWQFASDITLMESVTGGMYVGSNGTFWIPGSDPYNAERRLVDDSHPELGAIQRVAESGGLIWKSSRGFIRGGLNGEVTRMNDANVSMDTSAETAMGSMTLNGTEVVIGVPQQPKAGKRRSRDWVPDLINDGCEG